MDIGLRGAFIISAIIHAAIAAPLYNYSLLKSDFVKKNSVIVEYVVLNQITRAAAANAAAMETAAIAESQKIDIKKTVAQDIPVFKHDKSYYRKKTRPAAATEKKDVIQRSKDYIDYYELLKERIRTRLQENYRFYKGEGDIYLSFVLNTKGALVTYNIDRLRSSKDDVLLHITGASLTAVAPFPPIPKTVSTTQMSFNITVSFKK